MESPRPQPGLPSLPPPDEPEKAAAPNGAALPDVPVESVQAYVATQVVDDPVAVALANHLKYAPEVAPEGVDARPLRFADFRLLGKLGEGAMGTVYKARQVSTNRDVALKVLFPHMARNPKLLERFYREARMMGRFDHPNIVSGYAVGEEHGRHYFAMEFVDGPSLQKWLSVLGKMSVGDALHIILACARAVQYVHDLNLVHRDIKPDNVLITKTGVIKVTDLGVAKFLDEDFSLTQTGNSVGTPFYMPPEQARNAKEADARSDIYALGCTLYCTLTGRPPFTGATLLELIQSKEAGKFLPARRFNPEVPERLDLIIDKMVAKQVRYRYASCTEVIKDLEALGLAAPVLSFLPSNRKRSRGSQASRPTALGPADTPVEFPAADVWYVRYKNPDGKKVTCKLSTRQVLGLINDENFDFMTKARRSVQDGYRSLASFREFEAAFLTRVAKTTADQRTSGFRNLYKKLHEEDRQRQQEWYRNNFQPPNFTWPALLYWFASRAALVGAVVLAYFVLKLLISRFLGLF